MKKISIIIGWSILFFLIVWMQIRSSRVGQYHFDEFNSSNIDSEIKSVRIAYKGTGIRLIDGREFVFYPFTDNSLNNGSKFLYTAEKGDHIYKLAFSDTLYLVKRKMKFAYTFKKFN